MGAIFERAVCDFGIKFALIFLIAPLGVLFLGYLVFILVESAKELRQNNARDRKRRSKERNGFKETR